MIVLISPLLQYTTIADLPLLDYEGVTAIWGLTRRHDYGDDCIPTMSVGYHCWLWPNRVGSW